MLIARILTLSFRPGATDAMNDRCALSADSMSLTRSPSPSSVCALDVIRRLVQERRGHSCNSTYLLA